MSTAAKAVWSLLGWACVIVALGLVARLAYEAVLLGWGLLG